MKCCSRLLSGIAGLALLLSSACSSLTTGEARVLVFSKTAGYRHQSIENGVEAIRKLGQENGFAVIHTEDASQINDNVLKDISAVVFLSTTGDILDAAQQVALERYIQAGGGFAGIHAAADTEYDWKWYGDMVGGYFHSHPEIQKANIDVIDAKHPATKSLPPVWTRTDEWYNYKEVRPNLNVLLKMDEKSYKGGNMGADHPISWYHEYDGGRVFYTGLGHTVESYSEPEFLKHILGGIQYAIGKNRRDYGRVSKVEYPDPTRFVKTELATNLDEPMELDMLPDGRILFVERKGNLKIYDPRDNYLSIVTKVPVNTTFEDGLLGLAIDPNYQSNHWVYLYYADPVASEQHLSRFVFWDDSLHYASEKVLLRVPTQREECCHAGGSVEFGPDGLLYVSTGDNTNPFASDGYAPIDERPGRSAWDAQKSSANANDLRGKVLRIKPEPNGAYSIPEGNLFKPGTTGTRPEIFVMGCRNPFRISIDSRRNWLYWGDVGPDAGKDSLNRGPKGYDGINQAKQAGFWGWPYNRGNNHQYHDYNFATGKSGPKFDPSKPFNDSPNNTGIKELPPVQPSLIWYSYDESQEFPWVGTGGKNPMAGPVYYYDDYDSDTKLPQYYDGKLFIYDWMRHWIFAVTLDSLGRFVKADPFMPETSFSRPMDMIIGKDGRMYLLEYGEAWFSQNLDARLSRIDYVRGNRGPQAVVLADKTIGGVPLTVNFTADSCVDLDRDQLSYEWWVEGKKLAETGANLAYTFNLPGSCRVKLVAKDPSGRSSEASITIEAGNDPPEVAWRLEGNQTFYWDKRQVAYQVSVKDREDGDANQPGFGTDRVIVSFDYLPQGADQTVIAQGHLAGLAASKLARGASLIGASDCKNCHAADKKINGPSYLDIADRYRKDPQAPTRLAAKVIAGGNGNWGETVMSAHPTLTNEQALEMVKYILSLGEPAEKGKTLPLKGTYTTAAHLKDNTTGIYVLLASYTDLGSGAIGSATGRAEYILRHPRLQAEKADEKSQDLALQDQNGNALITGWNGRNWLAFKKIDLNGLAGFRAQLNVPSPVSGASLELRLDKADGPLLAKASLPDKVTGPLTLNATFSRQTGKHHIYLVLKGGADQLGGIGVDWVEVAPAQAGKVL